MTSQLSLVDASWELIDPNPDIFAMFIQFNHEFFWDKLGAVEVKWSKKMTLCAGLCRYTGKFGLCSVVLSEPLLKLRPRKDLVETLLHEMIHAYLFVADGNREHDAHGPKFQSHMNRINERTGTNITIYHSFHDEVKHYKNHWWKCDGPCQHRPPFFGMVKRSMNRKPGPHDLWHAEHQRTCGGNFIKIKEPSDFNPSGAKKKPTSTKSATKKSPPSSSAAGSRKIDDYFSSFTGSGPSGVTLGGGSSSSSSSKPPAARTTSSSSSSSSKPPAATATSSSSSSTSTSRDPFVRNPTKPKPIPNSSKENKTTGSTGQGANKFPKTGGGSGSGMGGVRMGGGFGSRTVTVPNRVPVVTIDDDDDRRSSNTGNSTNTGNRLTGNTNNIVGVNNNNSCNKNTNSNTTNPATATSGGALYTGFFAKMNNDKKPAATTGTGFTPFSGQGYALGSGGGSNPPPKKPRYC